MDYRDRCGQIFNSGFIQLEPVLNVIILILQQPSKKRISYFLNKSPGTLPRLLFFVFLYPIAFYVIFSAFFEFVVLAVYVAARNFWHIAPFLSYCMCTLSYCMCTIVCVPGSLPFPARRQMLSFTICRIFYPRKHKCRCIQQRHLNKERNFSAANPSYVLRKFFFPHLLYIVYQIFRCTQIFVGFFDGNKKSAARRFFKYGNFFLLCSFLCTPGHMPWR